LAHKDETVRFCEEVRALEIARPPEEECSRWLRPDEPGFVVDVPDCFEKYGLHALPNPAIGGQPFWVIIFPKHSPCLLMYPENGVKEGRFRRTEAVVVFDLTAPIGAQVKAAQQLLERQQEKKIGHLVQPGKRHPAKWLSYLRVLDAKESGASLSQIAKSGVLGPARRTSPQSARDALKQAKALCFKWPS
jgi:hypothetical protein